MTLFSIVLIASVCTLTVTIPVVEDTTNINNVFTGYHQYKLTNIDYLRQYKDILELFKYIHQETYYKPHVEIAKDYSIEDNLDQYANTKVVKDFLRYYRRGMLEKDAVFSVFNNYQLKQAIALFKLFYYAKDYESFYKTACWARYHLNQGMFLYSFSVALIHRHDTYSMVLPPIYEIYPYYFFNTEVQKAQQYKQLWTNNMEQKDYVIYANYSGPLSYFTEDVGINSYYYYYNLYRPFWLNHEIIEINTYYRGEEFYYFYQQLLARYYLERLSNDFGEIKNYDYSDGFKTLLRYSNGLFPERSNWVYFFPNYYKDSNKELQLVTDYERRIRDAIDQGYIYTETEDKLNLFQLHGFNILGNLIEGNPQSPNSRFYGCLQVFARHLLGYSYQSRHEYKIAPTALQHFETSLRDPAFWQLYKRLSLYFQKYKNYLPNYTYDDLIFPGVKIESLLVDRLETYFDHYNVELSNAVFVKEDEWEQNNFKVYARQRRLNHKPFTYKINVISEKATQVVVRVFIGPKYDEFSRIINLDENRINFVEIDRFKYELKPEKNVIERNSQQMYYSTDRTTYKELYQQVLSGISGTQKFLVHGSEVYYAFPNRFLLPKGKSGGLTYQLYVIISPYKAPKLEEKQQQEQKQYQDIYDKLHEGEVYDYFKHPVVGLGVQYLDAYPLGYPFDRSIDDYDFYVPNSYFQDVVIYHYDNINTSTDTEK